MAAIGIVVTSNGYKIDMDQYEWTGLTVNDKKVKQNNQSRFIFESSNYDLIRFTATANLTATNPGDVFVLEGDGIYDYVCVIWYLNDPFRLEGVLFRTTKIEGAKRKSFGFSQGMMLGSFSKAGN